MVKNNAKMKVMKLVVHKVWFYLDFRCTDLKKQSPGSCQAVVGQLLGSHQAVVRQSSDNCQTVVRQLSGSRQAVIGQSLGSAVRIDAL